MTKEKRKAMLPKLIAACEQFRRAKITSFNSAMAASLVVAKEGQSFEEIASFMQGACPHSVRSLMARMKDSNLVRFEKVDVQIGEKAQNNGKRKIVRVYPTPYLRDVMAVVESELWDKTK